MTTAMYDQVKAPATDGAMVALDQQLDRLDNSLERLARVLMPVTRHEPTDSVRPEEYAPTAIRERIVRLSSRLDNLDVLMNSIDL